MVINILDTQYILNICDHYLYFFIFWSARLTHKRVCSHPFPPSFGSNLGKMAPLCWLANPSQSLQPNFHLKIHLN